MIVGICICAIGFVAMMVIAYEREGGVPVALADAKRLFDDDPYRPGLLEKFSKVQRERQHR